MSLQLYEHTCMYVYVRMCVILLVVLAIKIGTTNGTQAMLMKYSIRVLVDINIHT